MTIVAVDGGRLESEAAASYNRARAAGLPAGITSSTRTYAEQKRLRDLYLAGKGNYALPPGTSLHEKGRSLDLPVPARNWMAARGGAYGWRRTNKKEPWHFDYFPGEDRHRTQHNKAVSAATQAAVRAPVDGYWGDQTDHFVNLLRAAINGQFPFGVDDAQWVVGAKTDGIWGKASQAAMVETIKALQRAWGVKADGVWGPETDAAYSRARQQNYKTW